MIDDETMRTPPHDVMAEQVVLGGMLLSREAVGDAIDIVTGGDFYRPAHETVFQAIVELHSKGEPANPITVVDQLRKTGDLERAGGIATVGELGTRGMTAANVGYYAEIVRDHAERRRMIKAGQEIAELAYSGRDVNESTDLAQTLLTEAITVREDDDAAFVGDAFHEFVSDLEEFQKNGHAQGVPTGFIDLDSLTFGLHAGQMVIIAGRPAMGKSTLGVDILRSASIKHGLTSAFFSLEMSRGEVQQRLMSAEARIGLHHIRGGSMTDSDWSRFADVTARVTAAPLLIDATPGRTVAQIRARCLRLKQQRGLDLVVIDYLQLLESGDSRRADNRQVEVSRMSRQIKLMAKELQVPVIVLAQLNRGPEQRTDKLPALSDLRESGALEQDADVVILVHREDAYDKESPRAGEADLIVAKHRNGPTATITVAFQGHYSRFVDMAQT